MSDPIVAVQFHDMVATEYRRIVNERSDTREGINRQDAFAFANEAIRIRIAEEGIEVPIDDLIHSALLAADTREGAAGDNLISELASDQIGLDLWPDPRLDQVVVLGAGKRKPFRYVTAEDVSAMYEIRRRNTNAARRSQRRFKSDMDAVLVALVDAGSVGHMVARARQERLSAPA